MADKREQTRTLLRAQIKLIHSDLGEMLFKTKDISDGGLFLVTKGAVGLSMGETVQVQSTDIEDAPMLTAKIVRLEPEGIGLQFELD